MKDPIEREDAIKELAEYLMMDAQKEWAGTASEDIEDWKELAETVFDDIPSAEPNLILPERVERGECYEVGETIVVMNHDDYYDLLCKAMENEPKQGEWILTPNTEWDGVVGECSECGSKYMFDEKIYPVFNFCPNCGARMKGADNEKSY